MTQKGKQSKRQDKNLRTESQTGKRESRTQQTTSKKQPETAIAQREQYLPAGATISPFSLMRRFSEEMDRLFGDLSLGGGLGSGIASDLARLTELEASAWSPQVEVFERNGKLNIRADLPGLTKDDINVDITDNALVIRGQRQQEKEENEEGYYRSERTYGSFYRQIPLPSGVNLEEASANFRNGVLEITLPAPERQPQSRRIEIGEGSQPQQQPQVKAKAAGA
jgi:HSP20 family protein